MAPRLTDLALLAGLTQTACEMVSVCLSISADATPDAGDGEAGRPSQDAGPSDASDGGVGRALPLDAEAIWARVAAGLPADVVARLARHRLPQDQT